MDDFTIVRALHVASVVLWIGGVAFVTTVLLPTVRRLEARQEQMQLFDQIEQRFAWHAMVAVWLLFVAMLLLSNRRWLLAIKTGSILQGCRMAASNPTVHQFGHRFGGSHG